MAFIDGNSLSDAGEFWIKIPFSNHLIITSGQLVFNLIYRLGLLSMETGSIVWWNLFLSALKGLSAGTFGHSSIVYLPYAFKSLSSDSFGNS